MHHFGGIFTISVD